MLNAATHVVTKTGNWSDPTVWNTGTVPGTGHSINVPTGFTLTIDVESNAILKDIHTELGSTLRLDRTKATRLRCDTIMAHGIVDFTDDAESGVPGKPRHEIIFHATQAPGATARLGAMFMGPTRIRGAAKKGHLRPSGLSIAAGANTITLPGLATSGWRQGDTIIILGTAYVPPVSSDPQYGGPKRFYGINKGSLTTVVLNRYFFGQDEERTIQAINGDTVTLNAPLTWAHTGMTGTLKDGKSITVKPVVANVTRSIRFRTASAAEDAAIDPNADITVLQKRAHLMFMRQPDTDARYFETKNMGRTSTDPSLMVDDLPQLIDTRTVDKLRDSAGGPLLENPNNVKGRYAIHLHWCGGPHKGAPLVPLIGATAWAPIGGHPIPGWAITQHSTHAAIEDCVVSNVRGAGMVSEIGNEIGQWIGNVVTGIRGDGGTNDLISRSELYDNHNGSSGIAFENQSRAIIMQDNIAGTAQYGYAWHPLHSHPTKRIVRDVDMPFIDGIAKGKGWHPRVDAITSERVQIPPFLRNTAMATDVGLMVRHRHGQSVENSTIPMLIEEFHCLNVRTPWAVPEYSHNYYTKDCLWQGAIGEMATSKAATMGDVTWGWSFANIHLRNFNTGFEDAGAGLNYDGHFIDITTENVTQFTNTLYREFDKSAVESRPGLDGVMGPWTNNPTQPANTARRSARIRTYASIDSASLPSPYPLAPISRKLPAGHPPVRPGDTPYFVLGDGTNGAASTVPSAINLTLTAGAGRLQGPIYGIIRDSVGDRRWPDWQSSESFPAQVSVKGARSLERMLPEELIQRWGCFNDSGTWKCRAWFKDADRFTHVRFSFHVDYTLVGFEPAFLARHDLGGPPAAPEWPVRAAAIGAPRTLAPISRTLRFASRTRLEVVAGQPLSHRLRTNAVNKRFQIVGGADQAQFAIMHERLTWASGTRTAGNSYAVTIRVTDDWGNTKDEAHQVVVVSSARVSATIVDSFDRADENLTARPAYAMLRGDAGAFAVRGNTLASMVTTDAVADLGSLGTSEQQVTATFRGNSAAMVLMRMVDADNWIGFRRSDGGGGRFQVYMCVNGAQTLLGAFPNVTPSTPMKVRCQDSKMVVTWEGDANNEPQARYPREGGAASILDLDPLEEPGAMILPANAPRGTKIGLKTGNSTANPWIDNLTAMALPS